MAQSLALAVVVVAVAVAVAVVVVVVANYGTEKTGEPKGSERF
ncbi:hypothetical protein [Paraburkholderia domus]|nr:hypothetical protein [Paraburkholderia domus]